MDDQRVPTEATAERMIFQPEKRLEACKTDLPPHRATSGVMFLHTYSPAPLLLQHAVNVLRPDLQLPFLTEKPASGNEALADRALPTLSMVLLQ